MGKTRLLSAIILLIGISNMLNAQNLKWFKNQGSSLEDQTWVVAPDSNNNIFTIGFFSNSITLGNITKSNKGGRDHFIAKNDACGNALWVQTIASTSDEYGYRLSLFVDKEQNIYVTSAFAGSCTFSSANNSNKTLSSNGDFDIYIAKYDNNGNLKWVKGYGSSTEDVGYSITCDDSSNVYTTGRFSGSVSFGSSSITSGGGYDVFVTKHDKNGSLIWVKQGTGSVDDEGDCISVDSKHNVYVGGNGGYSNGTVTFNSISSKSSAYNTAYLAKLDINGNCKWIESVYSAGGETAEELVIDSVDNIYITGQHGSSVTATSEDGNKYTGGAISGSQNVFIARYDTSGNLKWFVSKGGSSGRTQGMGMCLNLDKTIVYVSGSTASSLTLGSYSNSFVGADDFFITSVDTAGNIGWGTFGGSSGWDRVHSVNMDRNGNLLACGLFENSCTTNGKTYNTVGDIDGFVIKYNQSNISTVPINLGSDKTICSGDSVSIGVSNISSQNYLWSSGDTTATIFVKPSTTTTYILKTYTPCDTAYDTIQIIVNAKPVADFSTVGNTCTPKVTFKNNSTGYNTIDWDLGDGNTSTNTGTFSNTYAANGTYNVKLIATASTGCKDSITKKININSDTINTPAFKVSDTVGCLPLSITYTNQSNGATNYIWDFGDGNTDTSTNTNHIYNTSGSFTVKLYSIDSFGCKLIDSSTTNITVQPKPSPNYTNAQQGCTPIMAFTNTTVGGASYKWDFGDGNTSSNTGNFSHTYATNGNYNVKLVAFTSAGCKDSITKKIVVSVDSINTADFTVANSTGCPPLNSTFNNKSIGAVNYFWDFGDGNTSTNANTNHIYNTSGTFIATLYSLDSFGCKTVDTATATITVQLGPVATFSFSQQPCTRIVDFTNTTSNALNYKWDFGDGNTDTSYSPSHTYNNVTTYKVLLTVNGVNCSDTEAVYIPLQIDSLNTAAFTADNITGCAPVAINFTNKSLGGVNYVWDFGDGGVDNNINTSHTFATAGVFIVKLVSVDPSGCKQTDTAFKTITIITSITADFGYDLNTCNGEVTLIDSQTNSTKWEWYIGNDTITYKTKNALHKFKADGLYDIKYKIYNGPSCVDSIIKTLDLQGISTALFLPDAFSPNNDGLNDKFEVLGNLKCVENFSLEIFNRWGERVFSTTDLTNLWDGKSSKNHSEMPEGVYLYILKTKEKDFAGKVKLVR